MEAKAVAPNVVGVTHFILTGLPDSFTAGSTQNVTVTAADSNENTVTDYTGTIILDSPNDGFETSLNYTFVPGDNGVHTFPIDFVYAIQVRVTAVDTSDNNIKGTSPTVQVVAGPAIGFEVKHTCCTTAGGTMFFAVTAIDIYGNADRNYTGTVHFTSSDPLAVLPDDMEYLPENGGGRNMNIILKTAGGQTVTATDTVNPSLTGYKYIQVRPDNVNVLFEVTTGATGTTGTSQDVTVLVEDSYGNIATGYSGTVHFTSSDPLAVLPEDYTYSNSDQGSHAFPVTFNNTGSQSVTATQTDNSDITGSASTTIAQGVKKIHLEATFVSSSVSGVSHDLAVSVKDTNNNPVSDYTGTVHFTSSDPQAVLPADYTFTAGDAGTHTFVVTLKTVGSQTLTTADTVISDLTTSTGSIDVTPDVDLYLTLSSTNNSPNMGDAVDLTFTLKNQGSTDAHSSLVTVTLPVGLSLNSTLTSQGTYDTTSGIWTVGALSGGVSVTLKLNATVNAPGDLGVSGIAAASETETNTGNNQASLILKSQALGGISVAVTADNLTPKNGESVLLKVKVSSGANPVTGVSVNLTLPDGLTLTASTPTAGTYDTSSKVWTVGNLAANSSQTLALTGKVSLAGILKVTAEGSSNEVDLDLTDNTASVSLNSQPEAGLKLSTQAHTSNGSSGVKPGDIVVVEAGLTNLGPNDASNVRLEVQTPPNTKMQSYTISFLEQGGGQNARQNGSRIGDLSATYDPTAGKVSADNLPVGVTLKFTLTSQITGTGEVSFSFTGASDQGSTDGSSGTVTLMSNSVKNKVLPAELSGQLRVTPDRQAAVGDDTSITYTLTIQNFGTGTASGTHVNWPLDPNLALGYVTFSDSRAWVSSVAASTNLMSFTLPTLYPNQTITATVVMKPLDSARIGAVVMTHPIIGWNDDEASNKTVSSNAVRFTIGAAGTTRNDTGGAVQYFTNPSLTVSTGQKFMVQGDFYASNDLITFWYTDSKGVSVSLGTTLADSRGIIDFEVNMPSATAGEVFSISGYGNHSGVTGSGTVTFTAAS